MPNILVPEINNSTIDYNTACLHVIISFLNSPAPKAFFFPLLKFKDHQWAPNEDIGGGRSFITRKSTSYKPGGLTFAI